MDITALLLGVIAAVASFGGSYLANNKTQAVMQEQLTRLRADVAALSVRVDKHNNLIERTAVLERDVKTVFSRIDEVRRRAESR